VALAVINFQDRCHVSTAIAIIGCTEDSDHLLFLSQENKHTINHMKFAKWSKRFAKRGKKKKHQGEVVTWPQLYPSITSWWALAISFKLFVWLNCSDMSYRNKRSRLRKNLFVLLKITNAREKNEYGEYITWPKVYPAPLGEMPQPHRSSGSDHNRSHMGPSWGTSWTRSKLRMLSRVSMEGDNPPWRQNISDSTFKRGEKQHLHIKCPNWKVLWHIHKGKCKFSILSSIILVVKKSVTQYLFLPPALTNAVSGK